MHSSLLRRNRSTTMTKILAHRSNRPEDVPKGEMAGVRWGGIAAMAFGVLLEQPRARAASASPVCEKASEEVAAHAVGWDRYAVRVDGDSGSGSSFVLRRLSTGEPVDHVACRVAGSCQLVDVLGMKGCWFTPIRSSRATHGLAIERSPSGQAEWTVFQETKVARIPLLTVRADGDVELRTVRLVGRHVLLVLREVLGGSCPSFRERVIDLDEAEIRPGRARLERARDPVLLDSASEGEPAGDTRTVAPFRAMPVKLVFRAARTAVAAGMATLAACWIENSAAAMRRKERDAFAQRLAGDQSLARFAQLALLKGGRANVAHHVSSHRAH
jgi:hypothetical protein